MVHGVYITKKRSIGNQLSLASIIITQEYGIHLGIEYLEKRPLYIALVALVYRHKSNKVGTQQGEMKLQTWHEVESENATQVIFAKEAKECNVHPVDMAIYMEKHPNFVAGTALLVLIAHGILPAQ